MDRRLETILWSIKNWETLVCAGWEKRAAELYATAGEVAKALGGGK